MLFFILKIIYFVRYTFLWENTEKKLCQKDFRIFLCSKSKSFVKAVYFITTYNIYTVTHLISFDSLEHFGHGTLVRKQTDNYPLITAFLQVLVGLLFYF